MKTKFFYWFLSVLFLVFVSQLTFGAPPTSFYTPWETDDPSCIPGTANCDVTLDGLDTDDQTLSLSWSSLSIQDGNTIVLPSVVDTDDQSLTLSWASLSIDDGNTLDLSSIWSFLTTTWSNITGIPADIADGDDDTQLTESQVDAFVANNWYLTGELDGSVTNEIQNLSLSGSDLTISSGNTIVLPSVVDTDDQSLTLSWASLSIDDGNTLDLSSIWSFLTTTWSNITGIPADIADGDDDTQLTESQVDAFVANNWYLTGELDGSVTNEIQNLSLSGTTISISDGTGVDIGSVLEPNLNIYNSNGTIWAGRTVGVTDTVNFDNSTLFVDGVNNSIGIGTITPERKLHVEGWWISLDPVWDRTGQLFNGTSSQDGSEINTITNGYAALQRSNANANLSLSKNSSLGVSTGQFLNMVSDNNIIGSFTTGNGVDLGINVNRWGNVGIGVADPQSKLSVVGLPSGTTDAIVPGTLAGAVCITTSGNMYIDTDGTCAN